MDKRTTLRITEDYYYWYMKVKEKSRKEAEKGRNSTIILLFHGDISRDFLERTS